MRVACTHGVHVFRSPPLVGHVGRDGLIDSVVDQIANRLINRHLERAASALVGAGAGDLELGAHGGGVGG